VWDTQRLLPAGALPASYRTQALATPECDSFLHLHLGIDATGLPADLDCHHVVVNDWDDGVDAPQVCTRALKGGGAGGCWAGHYKPTDFWRANTDNCLG
jgi:phytoene dehydrogenase-like protein